MGPSKVLLKAKGLIRKGSLFLKGNCLGKYLPRSAYRLIHVWHKAARLHLKLAAKLGRVIHTVLRVWETQD